MTEGVGREKTVGGCSGMVGRDQHGDTERMAEGGWYVNGNDTSWV